MRQVNSPTARRRYSDNGSLKDAGNRPTGRQAVSPLLQIGSPMMRLMRRIKGRDRRIDDRRNRWLTVSFRNSPARKSGRFFRTSDLEGQE